MAYFEAGLVKSWPAGDCRATDHPGHGGRFSPARIEADSLARPRDLHAWRRAACRDSEGVASQRPKDGDGCGELLVRAERKAEREGRVASLLEEMQQHRMRSAAVHQGEAQ